MATTDITTCMINAVGGTVRHGTGMGSGYLSNIHFQPKVLFTTGGIQISGVAITGWADWSNGQDATQAESAKRPASGMLNGNLAPTFNGTSSILYKSVPNGYVAGTGGEVWAVIYPDGHTPLGHTIFGSADEGEIDTGYTRLLCVADNADFKQWITWTPFVTTPNYCNTHNNFIGPGSGYVLRWQSDSSAYHMYATGVEQSIKMDLGTNDGNWYDDLLLGRDGFSIGAHRRNIDNNWFPGKIGFIMVFNNFNMPTGQAAYWNYALSKGFGIPSVS